jgi:bla regulator protein blaR1
MLLPLLLLAVAAAQTPDTFEVASIKPGDPLANGMSINYPPGGGIRMENCTLRMMVGFAWGLRDFQLSGGTGWIESERYHVLAKGAPTEGPADFRNMTDKQREAAAALIRGRLRKLLQERFQLEVHTETKELPIYALVVAKGGSKLKPNTSPDGSPGGVMINGHRLEATRLQMDRFAESLSGMMRRTVRNETGLEGFFDLKLEWTPDAAPGAPDKPAEAATGPTLLTALQEQLGLKLESKKGPVEILVIDRAERPTEN